MTLVCEEKTRLLAEYQGAARAYSATVKDLVQQRGILQKNDYEELMACSETARLNCEAARIALEEHIATHRC